MFGLQDSCESRYAVGLMSGTSVDGIDAACVEISGNGETIAVKLLAFINQEFPQKVREQIFELFDMKRAAIDKAGYLHFLLGELYARAALDVIAKAGLSKEKIAFIGSHGQTVFHHPDHISKDGFPIGFTVQIGEGAVIAQRTGIPCVSDFRVADMAAGGQGAPLVPFTEYLLYRNPSETVLLQNIGGIGNITVLPAGCRSTEVYAFDTGPGNMLIDGFVTFHTNGFQKMDEGGKIASRGQVNQAMLDFLTQDPYYQAPPPKSTGREHFGEEAVKQILCYIQQEGIPFEDATATITELTAWSIEDAYYRFIQSRNKAAKLLIGGGGSYNPVLVKAIARRMGRHHISVQTQEQIGGNSDAKEAVAFALLADCTMRGQSNNLPAVTGASCSVVMGKISLPPHC